LLYSAALRACLRPGFLRSLMRESRVTVWTRDPAGYLSELAQISVLEADVSLPL